MLSVLERCESGRIGLTANELTWETGSEGSNPSLSASRRQVAFLGEEVFLARLAGFGVRSIAVRSTIESSPPKWLPM